MKYRVVTITNDLISYPEYVKETLEFPSIREDIEDDVETFVVNENGVACIAEDFFHMNDIKEFEVK